MTIGICVIDTITDCLGNQDQLSPVSTPGTAWTSAHQWARMAPPESAKANCKVMDMHLPMV